MRAIRRIGVAVGTRPEVIKMAPVVFALRETGGVEPFLICTAQHREMLDQALDHFGLVPDLDLDLMRPGQGLPDLTARIISEMGTRLPELSLDALLVQGDTTTVLGASLAAFYSGIPVGHVEAGLRTGNLAAPWPEELNRRLVAPIARWHFAATERAVGHLLREGIERNAIHLVGNTVIDALLWTVARQDRNRTDPLDPAVASWIGSLEEAGRPWILVTGHRRESFGQGFENLCTALLRIAGSPPHPGILYPVHLNPRVRETVNGRIGQHPSIRLCEPVGYAAFVALMRRCSLIISDSGGVQEEAPSLGKRVIVTRETTERPEAVEAGLSVLAGTDPDRICAEAARGLAGGKAIEGSWTNPYGTGDAARRIVTVFAGRD